MQNRPTVVLATVLLAALLVLGMLFLRGDTAPPAPPTAGGSATASPADAERGELGGAGAATAAPGETTRREVLAGGGPPTGVRGVVVDAKTGRPLGGVEVVAIKDAPSIEPLVARFRGLFTDGMFASTRAPRRELGRTVSNADGSFELLGLLPGRVFLDARSDGWFVRTPGTARLAGGQIQEGIELRAVAGGRVRGIVLGADGGPAKGARVSLRPGLNAFFGQITERQYRWLETETDADGRFDLPGVPAGLGYTVAASSSQFALEEQHGVDVLVGQVSEVALRGHAGATIEGQVLDEQGAPVAAAQVAMVYLDISRVLFSADGRDEPIVSDAKGHFRIEHVAAGRVAFVAVADQQAPSNIAELAVVDGGVYPDLVLQLGIGATVRGRVVDDQQQPVAGVAVELRPFERPNDPQFLKMMLKVRRVDAVTDGAGEFVARGLTGERLFVQASKAGYTTTVKTGVKLDEPVLIEIERGVTVRGKVLAGDQPLPRFRVDTRSRDIPKPGDASARRDRDGGRDDDGPGGGPPWLRRGQREQTRQLAEGQTMMDRGLAGLDGNWQEIQSADGSFELHGVPPGRVRVRVRADGYLDAASQEVDLAPAATSELLTFVMAPGLQVSGTVVDDAGAPVSDAQVTAYRQDDTRRRGPFNFQIDPEDFDFLALSSSVNHRSAITDSAGRFVVQALEPGKFRFTARHPDLAKSSTKDVELVAGKPTPLVEIVLDAGGGVEGDVTGLGGRPLADALIVAFSISAGSVRSSTTDKRGYYRIDGLSPGQFMVFKSRLDERADNIPLELLSNMRLKAVTVRQGKFTRVDVHDDSEDGVHVFGVVREGGKPVPRALVSLLGSDRDGLLGMGVRAAAADLTGRYDLPGIKPGNYVMQVTRFLGQPVQTTFEVEIGEQLREFVYDIDLPTASIHGVVIDSRGNAVAGMQVTLGSSGGALAGADGLLGLIAQNGLSQARSNDKGEFTMRSVSPGTYKLTAGSAFGPPRRGGGESQQRYGEACLDGVVVAPAADVTGIVITVPLAGRVTGIVVDGSGAPVAGSEITYVETSAKRRSKAGNPLLDLLGSQRRPVRSGSDGRFEILGLTPGVYDLRVEGEALQAGRVDDVTVTEDGTSDVTLRVVRGATLRVRATNVDRKQLPIGTITLVDSRGKPVVNRMSTLSVMKRLMGNREEVDDSGWYTFGSVPPDTYTAILTEPGKEELRVTRTIADGELVEWDIDVAVELAGREKSKQ